DWEGGYADFALGSDLFYPFVEDGEVFLTESVWFVVVPGVELPSCVTLLREIGLCIPAPIVPIRVLLQKIGITLSKRGQKGVPAGEAFGKLVQIDIAPKELTYGDGPFGSRALRSALASFFNDYFHPVQKVLPDQLLVANGCTSLLDLVTFGIADEGDGILVGRPLYTGFQSDVNTRAGATIYPVSSEGKDPMSEEMVEQYEKELLKQEKQGIKIRAIILAR
ncbi:MAG: hypothetical protein Q9194_007603, partial [Teloschistes cf. exilis]